MDEIIDNEPEEGTEGGENWDASLDAGIMPGENDQLGDGFDENDNAVNNYINQLHEKPEVKQEVLGNSQQQQELTPQVEVPEFAQDNGSFSSKSDRLEKIVENAQEGDYMALSAHVEQLKNRQLSSFFNGYVFGPVALFYAYRGGLSKTERLILGAMGAAALYYKLNQSTKAKQAMDYLKKLGKN